MNTSKRSNIFKLSKLKIGLCFGNRFEATRSKSDDLTATPSTTATPFSLSLPLALSLSRCLCNFRTLAQVKCSSINGDSSALMSAAHTQTTALIRRPVPHRRKSCRAAFNVPLAICHTHIEREGGRL